jgi:hypothetical protein
MSSLLANLNYPARILVLIAIIVGAHLTVVVVRNWIPVTPIGWCPLRMRSRKKLYHSLSGIFQEKKRKDDKRR